MPQNLHLLSLDGGASRVIVQCYLLEEMLHRVAWDRGYIRDGLSDEQTTKVYACDYFDWIGGAGTGCIIAFLLASRKTAIDARKTFMRIAPILRNPISDLVVLLESELSGVPMEFEGNIIIDQPCQTNVWIRGTCVLKGMPLKHCLLPLVLDEVRAEKEPNPPQWFNSTQQFFREVCPSYRDCTMLVSLGSGKHPRPTLSTYTSVPGGWLRSAPKVTTTETQQTPAPCAVFAASLPTSIYRSIYFRLNPHLIETGSYATDDWETTSFGNHKTYTISYCENYETGSMLDRIVTKHMMRPEPVLPTSSEPIPFGVDCLGASQWGFSEYR